ncbi:MAG: hypothetical protein WCH65_06435 [bacterium]
MGAAAAIKDTAAPKVLEAQIRVTKNANGTYAVTLPLDEPSGLLRGKITRNGVSLYEYKNGTTANFTIDALGPVVISAADTWKNTLNQTVDLNAYMK